MKFLKYAFLLATALFMSCSSDDNNNPATTDETDGLTFVESFHNNTHTINLFTENGELTEGYNRIFLQIKDTHDNFIKDASLSWSPLMYMHNMQHACPFSQITKTSGKQTLYQGYIVFQMASNDSEYWELTFDYTIGGTTYQVSGEIDVFQSDKRRVSSFMGSDNQRYIVALIEPSDPKVAINDMSAGVFRMETMMSFPVADNYKLKIDPRMPGMGNHGSPNNVDLTQGADGFYHGKVSLTMTGYWKINLILEDQNGDALKGEEITETNQSSSIFFEIEF